MEGDGSDQGERRKNSSSISEERSVDPYACGMLVFSILSTNAEIQALSWMLVVNRCSADRMNSIINPFGIAQLSKGQRASLLQDFSEPLIYHICNPFGIAQLRKGPRASVLQDFSEPLIDHIRMGRLQERVESMVFPFSKDTPGDGCSIEYTWGNIWQSSSGRTWSWLGTWGLLSGETNGEGLGRSRWLAGQEQQTRRRRFHAFTGTSGTSGLRMEST